MACTGLVAALLSSCSASAPATRGNHAAAPRSPATGRVEPRLRTPIELWAAPADPMQLTRAAGLEPERSEHLEFHVHAHLDVIVNGRPVIVPAGIGIDVDDPGVHSFSEADGSTSYGGIDPPCAQVCISPLHTHAVDGVLHTESKTPTPNRLAQFFREWNVRLTDSCVGSYCTPDTPIAFYLDGRRYGLDPRSIELADSLEIAIVIGTPPPVIPSVFPA
jgi:hypothetical protein